MKKTLLIITAILFAVTGVLAQTPNQFKYQAVLRDASGNILAAETVAVYISILQGSVTGTSVFNETHNTTTTAQGLINLNIGSINDMGSIDWAADTYFVEISVNGTVMGTSQLLSVPYAMNATTAETADYNTLTNLPTLFDETFGSLIATPTTISGYGITDAFSGVYSDLTGTPTLFDETFSSLTGIPTTISGYGITDAFSGVYSDLTGTPTLFDETFSSLAGIPTTIAGYGITDAFSGSYTDLTNKPTIDGSETTVTAGTNVTIIGTGTTADPYIIHSTSGSAAHYVGELYGGGVVFWVDETGTSGLIVSMIDLSTSTAWSNITDIEIGITARSDWNGAGNTTAITNQSGHPNFAATLCEYYTNTDYGTGTYSDWYLPSIAELNHIWNNFYEVQKVLDHGTGITTMAKNYYWSSTEMSATLAGLFYFGGGFSGFNNKSYTGYIRGVRAF